jgi:transposase-like protein
MNRKVWSARDKTAIVLEMTRGGESMAAIYTRHGVSQGDDAGKRLPE